MLPPIVSSGLFFTLDVPSLSSSASDSSSTSQTSRPFVVVQFDFRERYNTLYEADILCAVRLNQVRLPEIEKLLEARAVLKVWENGRLVRSISGIIGRIEQGDRGTHHLFYRLQLVPNLYRLTLRARNRIFQQKSIEDIIRLLLKENHIPFYDIAFKDPHPIREYCVQYRETDFEFLQRLTGEEGIIFHTYQQDESQEGVLFYDDWRWLIEGISLPYNLHSLSAVQQTAIRSFRYAHQLRPHQADLRDYTFKHPNWQADYRGEKQDNPEMINGEYRIEDYPGRYKDGRGKQYAQYRLDSLRREARLGEGQSNSIALAVGFLFQLNEHPDESLNTLWQPIAIHHHGEQPQALEEEAFAISLTSHSSNHAQNDKQATYLTNHFQFIPRRQSYRANFPQKPQISGPQTAVVVGPAGEEIFTDNQGRVKVQFHWDREGKQNDHSSCWIRVASPWAGEGWGVLALPRVGQEVIVSFQEGDPDQPIITGRVYNVLQIPPGNLPASKTQMHIQSKTYKGKGYNSIMFDDATHNELFYMQAERDMETLVKHDQRNLVKNDRTFDVKGTQTTTIGKGRSTTIYTGNDIKNVLSGNLIETISLLRSTQARDIFKYASNRIELEVGEQTSLTMDNEKILLRFGKNTILMNQEGIWLDGVHIGLQEKELDLPVNPLSNPDNPLEYSHYFVLVDPNSQKPLSNVSYVIRGENNLEIKGKTNAEGKTENILGTLKPEELNFYIQPNQDKKENKEIFLGKAYTQCRTNQSYTVCEYIEKRAVVIFIGGAGDQESYYFSGPNHNIEYAKDTFANKLETYFDIKNKVRDPIILGYNEIYDEQDIKIEVLNKITPYDIIYIIGHSLGGWNAAHLSRRLKEKGYNVKMLITLDPVGEGVLVYLASKIFRDPEPHPQAEMWINLRAESGTGDISDWVADFGEQWNIESGPDINETINVIHAYPDQMIVENLSTGLSAMDYLFESLVKEL